MRVGINILPLHNAHAARGSGTYLRLLLQAFSLFDKNNIYYQFLSFRDLPDVDCIHYPFFDPFFFTMPFIKDKPVVVTVHDLIPLAYPKHFPAGIRGSIAWRIQKWKLQRVSAIITDSFASKNDIVRIVHIPDANVHVVPLAPDPSFVPTYDRSVKKKYRLPDDYLLYVGDVNWNKNIPTMLRAMKNIDIPLVLVGKAFFNASIQEVQEIERIIDEEKLEKKIIRLGFVETGELKSIYSFARLTLCVSYAEGFGFPVVESMACGTPCVVSNTSSLSEIAGPSILVDPWNLDDVVRGVNIALQKDKEEEGKKALSWVKQFTWKRVVNKTITVYNSVI